MTTADTHESIPRGLPLFQRRIKSIHNVWENRRNALFVIRTNPRRLHSVLFGATKHESPLVSSFTLFCSDSRNHFGEACCSRSSGEPIAAQMLLQCMSPASRVRGCRVQLFFCAVEITRRSCIRQLTNTLFSVVIRSARTRTCVCSFHAFSLLMQSRAKTLLVGCRRVCVSYTWYTTRPSFVSTYCLHYYCVVSVVCFLSTQCNYAHTTQCAGTNERAEKENNCNIFSSAGNARAARKRRNARRICIFHAHKGRPMDERNSFGK